MANQPLLLHALHSLERVGVERVALVASDGLAEHLEGIVAERDDLDQEVECLVSPADGLAHSLEAAEDFIDGDRFVLHLGDSLGAESLRPLIEGAQTGDRDALVFVRDGVRGDAPTSGEVFQLDQPQKKPGCVPATALAGSAGLYVLGAGALEAAREAGPGRSLDLELAAALQRMEDQGGHLETRAVHQWWRYCRAPDAMLEANRFALEGLRGRTEGVQVVDSVLQAAVRIDPSATIESTVIRGPAVIGPRARLRDAYVGPYTSIGADVLIEGAEVENSIVLPGATISHLAGRLEASVIGSGARVFRDFRLPRAMRLTIGDGAVVALA